MKQCMVLTALVSGFLWSCTVQAQEAVTIKLKERGEGDMVLVKKREAGTSKVKVTDGEGKVLLDQNEIFADESEYKETVHKREGKKPASKVEREYIKSQTKKGNKEDSSLQGKTVIIEKKGDKYTLNYKEGDAVKGAAAAALMKEFSRKSEADAEMEKLMLPKTAVKVGDSWKLEMEPILKKLGKEGDMETDTAKATGTGKLLKTYQKDGKQFGEMKFHLDVPIQTMGKGAQIKFMAGAKVNLDILLDVCIDGTSETGSWKMKMNVKGNGTLAQAPGATMTLQIDSEVTESQKELPRK